ncbi:MAG TPA: PBP1A family penicillin-binding protein [Bacteroidota bacterium]|nr:PBP1A family penicillin-binding protein [Bacteroidota bacterium]
MGKTPPTGPRKPTQKGQYSSEQMKRYFTEPKYRDEMYLRSKNFLKKYWYAFAGGGIVLLLLFVIFMKMVFAGLPSLEQLENPKPELATKVFSYDGEVLGQFYLKNRTYISFDKIPQSTVDALICTEDKDFYSHWGVSPLRFVKAIIKDLLALRFKEGASTITQQLSRNLYNLKAAQETTFDKMTRKIREFITSVQIERTYTKKEILEMYLNYIYLGRGAYGVSAAASIYFDKSAQDLSLAESSLLIGMAKGPFYYDPIKHPDRAFARRAIVLSQMVKYGKLTQAAADSVSRDSLHFTSADALTLTGIAPHFVESVRQQLLQKADKYGFDIYKDGLNVYTTLDSRMQRYANRAVSEHLADLQPAFDSTWDWKANSEILNRAVDKCIQDIISTRKTTSRVESDSIYRYYRSNRQFVDSVKKVWQTIEVGLIIIDPHTGYICAMVGGSDFKTFKYGLNHTTQIQRQPGSAFKPFVYTVAIDNGYPPTFELLNQPVTLMMEDGTRWTPGNFDGTIGGKYTLREGLRESINLIAVRAIMEIAPKNQVIELAHRMGITTPIPPFESIALGTATVKPIELTSAFGVYANEGVYVQPVSILRIEDKDGNVIEENTPEKREVMSKETAYIMTSMLQDVVDHGSGGRVRHFFHFPAAGKTGTTQDFADAWFVGFTPQLVAGVWIGFDDQAVKFTSSDGQGGRTAAPLWGRVMKYIYEDPSIPITNEFFEKPDGVVIDTICADTKKLATPFCPKRMTEVFNVKYQPGMCDKHTSANWKESEENPNDIKF